MENQNSEKEGVTCIELHVSFHVFCFPVFVIHWAGELSALTAFNALSTEAG